MNNLNSTSVRKEYALISFDYPPNNGGVSRLCAHIVTGLSRYFPVSVITKEFHNEGTDVPTGSNIIEHRLEGIRPRRHLATLRLLRALRPNATIIASSWYPEAVFAQLAGRSDVVILAHGAELGPPVQKWRRIFWSSFRKWVLESARVVIANSEYTANVVKSLSPRSKVVTIPLSVDHQRFQPGDRMVARRKFGIEDDGRRVVATVARLEPHKGIDVVLRAIATLPDESRDQILYLVAGSGPEAEALRKEAVARNIGNSVRWLGFVRDEDLPTLYQAADLFVLCSREALQQRQVEGFGLVFLEAQACATPVVGTRTGGIPDAISEGRGGWLIDEDDSGSLAAILDRLIVNPEYFREAGLQARKRVEKHATHRMYIEKLLDVLADRSPAAQQ